MSSPAPLPSLGLLGGLGVAPSLAPAPLPSLALLGGLGQSSFTAYDLAVDAGSFALSGSPLVELIGRRLVANGGAFALSGQLVDLGNAKFLDMEAGSFTAAGQDVTFTRALRLVGDSASFTVSGQSVTLTYTVFVPTSPAPFPHLGMLGGLGTAGLTHVMGADAGAFTVSGFSALIDRELDVDAGSFALTGQDALLYRGSGLVTADVGTFTLVGSSVALRYSGSDVVLGGKLPEVVRLPLDTNQMNKALTDLISTTNVRVNGLAESRLYHHYNARTSAPTTGTWAAGDVVMNARPREIGTGGSKYVVRGWQCLEGGEPGTWVEMRYLTGN